MFEHKQTKKDIVVKIIQKKIIQQQGQNFSLDHFANIFKNNKCEHNKTKNH